MPSIFLFLGVVILLLESALCSEFKLLCECSSIPVQHVFCCEHTS